MQCNWWWEIIRMVAVCCCFCVLMVSLIFGNSLSYRYWWFLCLPQHIWPGYVRHKHGHFNIFPSLASSFSCWQFLYIHISNVLPDPINFQLLKEVQKWILTHNHYLKNSYSHQQQKMASHNMLPRKPQSQTGFVSNTSPTRYPKWNYIRAFNTKNINLTANVIQMLIK